jgi:hypothetical protein
MADVAAKTLFTRQRTSAVLTRFLEGELIGAISFVNEVESAASATSYFALGFDCEQAIKVRAGIITSKHGEGRIV